MTGGDVQGEVDSPSPKRGRLWLVGAAVLALGVAGAVVADRAWSGERVTACGFDQYGPRAEVRVGSLLGGLGAVDHEQVDVYFTYDGASYKNGNGFATVKVPVLGTTTATVHGTYPPPDFVTPGSGRKDEVTVVGRPVYRVPDPFGDRRESWPGRLVSKKLVARRSRLRPHGLVASAREEIVPDDLRKMGCSLRPPTNALQ